MKFFLVGGGTLGPVTPLLALSHALKRLDPTATFFWVGTPDGPEKEVVEREQIPFASIPVAKFPRHPSLRWLTFPVDTIRAQWAARKLLVTEKPDAVISVGGFTAVPAISEAAGLKIPCFTHQLDLVPGLSNKRIAKRCRFVTTTFEYEQAPFGNWVSDEPIATATRFSKQTLPTREAALQSFDLEVSRRTVLIFGGGTGAAALNAHVWKTLDQWLTFAQVIHITGQGKAMETKTAAGYVMKAMLQEEEMRNAYAAADLVICRAGMGALTELSALQKAAILVPMPKSHQEYNARAVEERGAVVVLDQTAPSFHGDLPETARLLLGDEEERTQMGVRLSHAIPTDDGTMWARKILREFGMKGDVAAAVTEPDASNAPDVSTEPSVEEPVISRISRPKRRRTLAARPTKASGAKKRKPS